MNRTAVNRTTARDYVAELTRVLRDADSEDEAVLLGMAMLASRTPGELRLMLVMSTVDDRAPGSFGSGGEPAGKENHATK